MSAEIEAPIAEQPLVAGELDWKLLSLIPTPDESISDQVQIADWVSPGKVDIRRARPFVVLFGLFATVAWFACVFKEIILPSPPGTTYEDYYHDGYNERLEGALVGARSECL